MSEEETERLSRLDRWVARVVSAAVAGAAAGGSFWVFDTIEVSGRPSSTLLNSAMPYVDIAMLVLLVVTIFMAVVYGPRPSLGRL